MILKPDTRVKIIRFTKKYGKIIGIVLLIWLSVILINSFLKNNKINTEPTTTYKPHSAVLDDRDSAPKKVQKAMEDFVGEYVEYCNKAEYEKAYNMISDECKDYNFNSFLDYKQYVANKFSGNKKYAIQNYSNYNDKYIYVVKLYDDFLATGLTNSTYKYQEEKISASYDENGKVVFAVGNFIERQEVKSVQENEYLKIDIISKLVKYSSETYEIKFTNRSENTIVIKNGEISDQVILNLGGEYRNDISTIDIVLKPGATTTQFVTFNKFYDDGDISKSIIFNSIRVVENYIEDNPNEDNSIDKFSMELGLE